jgi:hypothetical protein
VDAKLAVASYWLGIGCVLMTLLFRALAAVGVWPNIVPAYGAGISYNTFHHASELFLLLAIAAKLMSRSRDERS